MGFSWGEMFGKLKEYKTEFGHCNVPKRDGPLGSWVANQRTKFRENELDQDKVELLNSIGFVWQVRMARKFKKTVKNGTAGRITVHDVCFDDTLEKLKKFKQVHGHCSVPQRYEEDIQLGRWVKNKRSQRRKGLLSADKVEKLCEIGFDWGVGEWNDNVHQET